MSSIVTAERRCFSCGRSRVMLTPPATFQCTCSRRSCSCCHLSWRLRSSLGSHVQWLTLFARFKIGVSIWRTQLYTAKKKERRRKKEMTGQLLLGIKETKTDRQGKEGSERVCWRYLHIRWWSQIPLWIMKEEKREEIVYMLKCRVHSFQRQGSLLLYDKLMRTQTV